MRNYDPYKKTILFILSLKISLKISNNLLLIFRRWYLISKKSNAVQEWLPIQYILENGIIKLKNNNYIKIIKINPINFNLKSDLEKEAILNSYKIFLKTCNFNFQILVQSNKEDLTKHIDKIEKNLIQENNLIQNISKKYIQYIKQLNHEKKSSSKNFYIILKCKNENKEILNDEDYLIEKLNEQYFKIKECLSRCGNIVSDINNKKQIIDILFSFLNFRIYLNNN